MAIAPITTSANGEPFLNALFDVGTLAADDVEEVAAVVEDADDLEDVEVLMVEAELVVPVEVAVEDESVLDESVLDESVAEAEDDDATEVVPVPPVISKRVL